MVSKKFTRREFINLSGLALGGITLGSLLKPVHQAEFPQSEHLGRAFAKVEVKSRPNFNSQTVGVLYDDAVVPCLREVAGFHPYRYKQRYFETPNGYIWSSDLQPVRNLPNQPVNSLPETSLGQGMWVEVSVPFVDIYLENKPASPGFKIRLEEGLPLRLYYSQILWVDQLRTGDDGQIWYRVHERFGYGDLMWAPGSAFRLVSAEEMAPIHPEIADKRIEVHVEEKYQTLSCFEGNSEVYFCRISGGKKYDSEGKYLGHSATPAGIHTIWRKQVSAHMSGGTTGAGYDLPGIGWTTLFSVDGVAIHSTFWHNNFGGELMSHGCVNAAPEDAKWIFRWSHPPVNYDPGDLYSKDVQQLPTKVTVIEEE